MVPFGVQQIDCRAASFLWVFQQFLEVLDLWGGPYFQECLLVGKSACGSTERPQKGWMDTGDWFPDTRATFLDTQPRLLGTQVPTSRK